MFDDVTKLMLGMIPQAENPDVVRLLLRMVFDAGSTYGAGQLGIEIITDMLDHRRKDKDRV